MAHHEVTILRIVGSGGQQVLDKLIAIQARCVTDEDNDLVAADLDTEREIDTLCKSLWKHRSVLPILEYCRFNDRWNPGRRLLELTPAASVVISSETYTVACFDSLGNGYLQGLLASRVEHFEHPEHHEFETRNYLRNMRSIAFDWHGVTQSGVLICVLNRVGDTMLDEELESVEDVPLDWLP